MLFPMTLTVSLANKAGYMGGQSRMVGQGQYSNAKTACNSGML